MQLKKWKNSKKFQRILIRTGYRVKEARGIWVKMDRWRSVNRKEVRFVMNLNWFRRQGLIFLHDFTGTNLELPFGR